MKCPRCQHQNEAGAKFCEQCATPLARACVNCGRALSATARFCPECAHPTGWGPAVARTPRFGSPESYTPKHLAERILTSKAAIEGERKQVTVLFADMKGSMELLADRDPEEARKLLDPVLERMMEAVHRYEGTVNQVMGDGIMALFGAPLACEDHAVRACYAALRLQETVKRYAEQVRRAEGIVLQVRAGMNSGEVVVRSVGSDLHMDYTAVGRTTHVAARMEQMAMPGSILLSAETLALAEGYVEVRALGALPVKGLETPLEVYELSRAATIRSRFQAAAARGLSRFVGRQSELEQLRQALERARAGHGQVVSVVGEAGVGKSRLYWEFGPSHRAHGWLVLESRSVSYGKATNYLPVIELLRAYFSIEHGDEPRKIREKVMGKLLSLDRQFEPYLAPLLWLLDVPVEDERWNRLDPDQRRQRILDGVKGVLLRESQLQPVMVLFEDLHWIDAQTQALLDSLVESLPTARLLLLVNYRPEYSHGWSNKTYYRQIQIDRLPPESAEDLLDALLGNDATLAPVKRLVVERTEGNPFFIEECVRSLVETGALAGERGAYRLTRRVEALEVPATAKAILAARIDRLDPEDKRLLQAAAVIGTEVPLDLLQAVTEGPEDGLRRGLAQLQATEFLYETRLFPELEYTFKHALTHEVAYGGLLHERRRAVHARVVQAIEALHAGRLAEHVERLAHHAFRGELWDKALGYSRQAASKAMGRSAHREAGELLERALQALTHLPETRESIEHAIDIRLDLRSTMLVIAESSRLLTYLSEAENLARSLDDRKRLGWVSAYMMVYLWRVADNERALEYGRRAAAIAPVIEDHGLRAVVNAYLGAILHALGDYRSPLEGLRETIAGLEGQLLQERFGQFAFPSVISRTWLAWCLAELGQLAEAVAVGAEAMRIAERAGHSGTMAYATWGAGYAYLQRGDFHEAIQVLERGLELAEGGLGIRVAFNLVSSPLARAYSFVGRHSEGLALHERSLREAESLGALYWNSLFVGWQGESLLLAGRPEEAGEYAGRSLRLARERNERGNEAWALRLLGEIYCRRATPDAETAQKHYRQALARAEELGMRPLAAHCYLGLGKLCRRTGESSKAQEYLTAASAMLRSMDMRFWLDGGST